MKPHSPDYILIFTIIALIIFGLVALTSASVVLSQENFGENYHFLKHQFIYGITIGIFFLFLGQKIYHQHLAKIAFPALIITIIFLLLIFFPGIGQQYGGAQRWISLGPISIQPSEIAKLTFVLYLSALLAKKKERVALLGQGLMPFLIVAASISILIILQPDVSTLIIIIASGLAIYFIAGAKISHISSVVGLVIAVFFALIKIAPYRMRRLTVFLHPEIDPQGIGYQINQALLAIGSGGLFGRGLGYSLQKWKYLPEPISDSIFAITAEELGLIGALTIVVLFIIFAYRGFQIAKNSSNDFGRLLAVGITSWIALQAFVNIAAISGLIPLTGIPLPFISYGSSSMIISLAAAGILINVSKYTK